MTYREQLEIAERKLAAREGRPGLTANVEALREEIARLKPHVRKLKGERHV